MDQDIKTRLRENADLDEMEHCNPTVVALEREAADHIEAFERKLAELEAEVERLKVFSEDLGKIIHDMVVGQQAAWIEWRHGKGAEEAMGWIENGLAGPGHIPDEDAPYGKEPQAFYDANRADPFPACHCGRPSNILWMGKGFCSIEHYNAALAASKGA